jgi:DNA-binding response OmpR family regulator
MIDYINREKSINKYKVSDENNYVFHLASYKFDYISMLLHHDEEKQRLTFKEAELLKLLCLNLNNVVTREFILKTIWGNDDYFLGRSMDVFISRLRKHLKNDKTITIVSIRSRGFKLEVKEQYSKLL